MSPLLTSLIAFLCIFGGAFLGILLRTKLPGRHLSGDTKDIVRQGTGLIATLASLVLGLLIASANGKFEAQSSQVEQLIANVVLLDGTLKLYGPETAPIRAQLRREVVVMAGRIWRENNSGKATDVRASGRWNIALQSRFSNSHLRPRRSAFFRPGRWTPSTKREKRGCFYSQAGADRSRSPF